MNTELVYYLLYANYGNSVIASSDENRFKYQLFSIMFQYGPTWAKELEIQKEIRALDIESLREGSRNIVNQAANPSTIPSTTDTEELNFVNQQNVSKNKRSIADGYALLLSLLKDDVTESFLNKFKKLFKTIVEPERPLWYITDPQDPNYNEDDETSLGNIYDGVSMTRNFRNRYFTQIYSDYESFKADWEETPFATEV